MLYGVKETAALSKVTVKTLHHYHKTGLLMPCEISEAGYRLYGTEELERLQQIIFQHKRSRVISKRTAELYAPIFRQARLSVWRFLVISCKSIFLSRKSICIHVIIGSAKEC